MEQSMEREISLTNLFWRVLLGWRRIIALGVVFAILVSVFKYTKDDASYQAALLEQEQAQQETEAEEEKEEEEVPLTTEEKNAVQDARDLEIKVNNLRKYLSESVYMNINAYNTNTLILQYYVDSDYKFNYTEDSKPDYTDEVTAAYRDYAESGIMAEEIANTTNLGTEKNYISELISTSNTTNNIFEIIVVHTDEKALEKIKTAIESALEGQTENIAEKIGSHRLKLLSDDITVRANAEIATKQKTQRDLLTGYNSQLTSLKAAMTDAQKKALDIEVKEEIDTEEEEIIVTIPVEPSFSVKYLILGFLVGAFLACAWVAMEIILASRMQEAEELSNLYGVRELGQLTGDKGKKKLFGFVDGWIWKLRNRNKKKLTREQQIKIICSNLEIACKKDGISRLYITGSEVEKVPGELLTGVKAGLAAAGITVVEGENIIYDAKSLMEMAEIGHVVYVELAEVSLYREIEKEIRLAKENGINILGSIIVA